MSYAVFRQTHPPTGMEHCIEAHVTGENDINLVVAKTSFLQIYNLSPPHSPEASPSLDLVFEKTFFGNIESLGAVRYFLILLLIRIYYAIIYKNSIY